MGTLCNALTRRGGTCKRVAGPNGRCYWHGGSQRSTAGVQLPPHQLTSRWANEIPARMLDKYTLAADDPDILSLHADLALVDARLAEVLKRVDAGESGPPITLAAGMYWIAWTGTNASVRVGGQAMGGDANTINLGTSQSGFASTSPSGGVLPASLGTISPTFFNVAKLKLQGA